jgi:hypothetical protein
MTFCIGRPIIEILAREGAWTSHEGESVVAGSDLFGQDPYAEIERLRAALRPFVEADWYATGHGKYEGNVTGAALDEAKRVALTSTQSESN